MKIFDEMKKITPNELENAGVITTARRSGYICPYCGNGTGEDGDGLSVTPYDWGFNYRCFGKCNGANYTAIDLIAAHLGYDAKTQEGRAKTATRAKEMFNLSDSSTFSGENKKVAEPMNDGATEKNIKTTKNYSKFYETVQNQLAKFLNSTGGNFRGLSFEDWREVGAGIATAADLKSIGENIPASSRCLILPYNSSRFLIRSIDNAPQVKRGNTGGKKTEVYNPYNVNFEKAVFVPEGEIDAMSIHKAGFPAVALSGAGEYKILIRTLESSGVDKAKVRIILLFDNNDSGAGQNAAKKAIAELKAAGYSAVNFILSPSRKYDANEFLQKDFDGFRERLTEIYKQANREFAKIEGVEVLADVFDDLDEMSEKLKGNLLKWGSPTLDEKLPMLPGCYLLGALPSLGKTTFALNVAANVCEQGAAVLYISFEPTSKQIAVKDLARYWFKKIWNNHRDNRSPELVPTATQMMLGRYNSTFGFDEMKKVREELKAKRENFYFLQGRRETARDLISKIKPYVDNGVKFIVIDYIQLIKGTDTTKTAREQIDETIRELQIFQSENDLVILFISSFNRENYRNYACIESFKESGGLEFTADAILALQLKYLDGESRTDNKKFQEKKQSQPRDMELVGLKNRFGIDLVDEFAYHSAHETFIEKIPSAKNSKFEYNEVDED